MGHRLRKKPPYPAAQLDIAHVLWREAAFRSRRRDAHVTMGGPQQGGRLPSYCGDCVRKVVTKAGKAVEGLRHRSRRPCTRMVKEEDNLE